MVNFECCIQVNPMKNIYKFAVELMRRPCIKTSLNDPSSKENTGEGRHGKLLVPFFCEASGGRGLMGILVFQVVALDFTAVQCGVAKGVNTRRIGNRFCLLSG